MLYTVKSRHIGRNESGIVERFATIAEAETRVAAINNKPFSPYYAWVEKPESRAGGEYRYSRLY